MGIGDWGLGIGELHRMIDPKAVIASETECSEAIPIFCGCFISLRYIRNDNWAFLFVEVSWGLGKKNTV
ncbi:MULTISPECIES: hypothetical protein [unclassified Tolypothrix]|uniref:hypothetical protein n=1 Tax=unclassified Tolypothrix TaxID=2649714 RepID=UPI0005EAB9C6|nr:MULTISPECIES: hypothetical protein [unclassified Tolypothrix]EKF01785.1 hypothetical protein FDUTEX481_07657 [Tolypothrix sp. PCC 7601]UYD33380.1 hypothetical protein HG267_31280 [Tolypothrix sp. PCC 7601]